ncbi:hypothetical protein ACFWSK_30590, partial [Streptomyces sp. NPDC058620]
MTSGDGSLYDFDAQSVAAQIIARSTSPVGRAGAEAATCLPAERGVALLQEQVSAAGLLPDSLTDRGNAKLFVRLYARDYRHVTGLGWY